MKTYKVKATYSVDVEIDIDAASDKEALSKLYAMSFREVVEDGIVSRADSEDETTELIEAEYKIHVKSVDYDVEYSDLADQVHDKYPEVDEDSDEFDALVNEAIAEVKKSLPQQLDVIVACEAEDVAYYVAESISEKTGWLVNGCEYDIVEAN